MKRDGPECCDCGKVTFGPGNWEPDAVVLEVDHDTPLWSVKHLPDMERRRYFLMENLKLRCAACHKAKSARETRERTKKGRSLGSVPALD